MAFVVALAVALPSAVALWWLWCARRVRSPKIGAPELGTTLVSRRPWGVLEPAALAAILCLGLLRFDLAANGWDAPYTFFAEEGEALAWAHVVLNGGVLSRDVYCLYGPFATYPIVGAFLLFEPSIWLWRVVFYLLDVPALLAVYALLREMCRTRAAAWAGVALVLFLRMWPMPGMSWSLLRTGIGIGAIAALAAHARTGGRAPLVLAGALVGVGLLFSQEAGLASGVALCLGITLDAWRRERALGAPVRGLLAALAGLAVVLVPLGLWAAAQGALAARVDNLAGFSRLRWLGHGAQPFPALGAETLALYFAPVLYVVVAFRAGVRVLAGTARAAEAVRLSLAAYGLLLFASPLSRPDLTHLLFAMLPAFALVVVLSERALDELLRWDRGFGRRSAAAASLAGAVMLLGAFDVDARENIRIFVRQAWLNVTARGIGPPDEGARPLRLPRGGGVRLPEREARDLEAVVELLERETPPGEAVWAFPNEPMVNFLADRPFASPYPLAAFAITSDQRRDLVASIERSGVRLAVVNRKATLIDEIPSRQATPEAWAYLDAHFVAERELGRFLVMRRSDARP